MEMVKQTRLPESAADRLRRLTADALYGKCQERPVAHRPSVGRGGRRRALSEDAPRTVSHPTKGDRKGSLRARRRS